LEELAMSRLRVGLALVAFVLLASLSTSGEDGRTSPPSSASDKTPAAAQAQAQPQARVRFDARSADGKKMLAIYARAVAAMKAAGPGEPTGWVFQWYSHWVKNDGTLPGDQDPKWKDAALMKIYPNSLPKPAFDLASEVWNGCQAHGDGMDENMFLPWHRMFVCQFEDIVRQMSGDESFTLPYWNYSTADLSIRGVIPPEFTKKNDPDFGALYVENRNRGVNNGKPIQQVPEGFHGDPLNTDILAACFYEDQFPVNGFCSGIDNVPHGSVHVQIGDVLDMGNVPWAANDPIFWLHHSNIDRLWASWNAGGRKNPPLTGQFAFADRNGNRIVSNVADFLDTAKQGYSYDKLEAVPDCPVPREKLLAAIQKQKRVGIVKTTPVKLAATGATRVTLEPVPATKDEAPKPLRARVQALPEGQHLYLVAKNLRTNTQPGVLYSVYLDLPPNPTKEQLAAHHVGTLNFFGAMGHGGDGHGKEAKKKAERFLSFDITKLAKTLHARNLINETTTLTILPAGQPAAAARPVIGEFSLVEQ
jgi:tyrosinase